MTTRFVIIGFAFIVIGRWIGFVPTTISRHQADRRFRIFTDDAYMPLGDTWLDRFVNWLSSVPLPDIPEEALSFVAAALLLFVAAAILRILIWIVAVTRQRRADRLERQALATRELTHRLQRDAHDADALIAAFERDAYRRGMNS